MDINRRRANDHAATYKANILDYDYVFSLPAERACFGLSEREIAVIIGGLDVFKWKTRWYGENIDANEIDALVSGIINQLMTVSEDCGGMPTQFQFVDCVLQYSNDGGDTWTPVSGWPEGAGSCFQGQPGADGCSPVVEIIQPPEDTHKYLNITPCEGEPTSLDITQEILDGIAIANTQNLDMCHITHAWYREMWEYHIKPLFVSVQSSYDNSVDYETALEAAWASFNFHPEWAVPFVFESLFVQLTGEATGNLNQAISALDTLQYEGLVADFYQSVLITDWKGYWFSWDEENWETAITPEMATLPILLYRDSQAVAWENERRIVSETLMKAPYLWDDLCYEPPPPGEWSHQFNFLTGLHDWTLEGGATWTDGIGVQIGGGSGTADDIMSFEIPSCNISSFEICFVGSEDGFGVGTATSKMFLIDDTEYQEAMGRNINVGSDCWNPSLTPRDNIIRLKLWVQTYFQGQVTVETINIGGTGENPFG